MCGLAHFLEGEGIATVVVGLIPQHVRAMQPPRALLVPFALGRPLGAPDDEQLQQSVLSAALDLLQRDGPGPVVERFHYDVLGEEAAEKARQEPWACPVTFPQAASGSLGERVASEIRLLTPWFDRGRRDRGHTVADVSGLEITAAANWLAEFLGPRPPLESPVQDRSVGETFKLAVEDLKAYYLEAITAQPGSPSPVALSDWFWNETVAGELLWSLRERLTEFPDFPDEVVRLHAQFTLVPQVQVARRSNG